MNISTAASVIGPWVCARAGGTWTNGRGQAIARLNDVGDIVAGILFEDWNGAHVVCHIAAEPGVQWADRAFLKILFDYPFRQLSVKRITLITPSNNVIALGFLKRLGFTYEATLKDAHPSGDLVISCMYRHQCRWLKASR